MIYPTPSFKKILVATDFSSASGTAFQVGLNLCKELGASLYVLHVFEYCETVPAVPGSQAVQLKELFKSAELSLQDLHKRACEVGVACETMIEGGIVSSEIMNTIASKNIELVVLGTKALHGFERLVFGSTAEEVLRKTSCPVLTVGPHVTDAAVKIDGPIVFATDFQLSTIHAIRYAASFGQKTGASLHCLHVLPRTPGIGPQNAVVPQIMADALELVATECGTPVKQPICVTTYGNEVANAIVDYARKERAKLIVLGIRHASTVAAHLAPHIAYRVISEAQCPVMTVAFPTRYHAQRAIA